MKNLLLSATALSMLSVSAFAADLPKRTAPAKAPAPVFTWAGGYVGGAVGVTTSNTSFHDYQDTYDNQLQAGHTSFGVLGGLYAGYNFQRGNFVYGIEASGNLMSGKLTVRPEEDDGFMSAQTVWNASLKARVGLALDKTLIYVAAGPSLTSSKVGAFADDGGCVAGFKKSNVFGIAIAGGVEHALTDKLIARFQVEYVASGKTGKALFGDVSEGPFGTGCQAAFSRSTTSVSAGLAYKF